jgi:hypothetical protein
MDAAASKDKTDAAIGKLERGDFSDTEISVEVMASKLEAKTVTMVPPTVETTEGSIENKIGAGSRSGSKQ